jgi:hypothetical protein
LIKKRLFSQETLIKTLLSRKQPRITMIKMRKSVALMLIVVFLMASCLIVAKPALSSADAAENSWASKASMQVARGALGVAVVNGKIYAIGGSAQDAHLATTKEFLSTNEEYDTETDTWTFKKRMPTPRAAFATAVYQNKIYCIGGKASSGYTGVNEVYDPATDTWETKTPMPTARGFVTANVVNGKIYLIGGSIIGGGTTINEVYDPATNSWTTKTSMPAYGGYVSAVFDAKIYLMAGSTLLIYEPATDDWSHGTPKPSGVGFGAAVATTGFLAPKRIYVIGDDFESGAYDVGVYNPESDTWAVGAKRLVTSYRNIMDFGVAIAHDILYVVGGYICDASYSVSGLGVFTPLYSNEQYTPFGYGTPDPSYDGTAPEIAVASPGNRTYYAGDVGLNFTVDEPVFSMHYELDGETAVEISGNTTIAGLSYGSHNITVYAVDAAGNVGASKTVFFTIAEEPEPFPVAAVAVVSTAVAAVIGLSLAVYLTKTRRTNQKTQNAASTDSSTPRQPNS